MFKEKNYSNLGETLYTKTLKNGMQVYLLPKRDFSETVAIIQVNFGSIDTDLTGDSENLPSGIAHFLEHKLFELPNGDDASLQFSKLSADSNAFTTYEKTAFYYSTLGENDAALELLQNFVMTADFSEESVEREKKIIAQEIDMYLDDVDYKLYSGILTNLYANTKLSEDIAGTKESLARITSNHLYDKHRDYYNPRNMILFLVGDFDKESAISQIEKNQSKFTQEFTTIDRNHLELSTVVKKSTASADIAKPKLALGFRLPEFLGNSLLEQKLKLRLFLSLILGWTSQSYQAWYDAGLIDDSFDVEIEVSHRFQFVILTMDTGEPIRLASQIRARLREFEMSPDFTQEHLELLKREIYGEFIRSLDSIEHLAMQLASYQTENESYLDLPAILANVDLDDILQTGHKFLAEMEASEFTIFPN